MLLKGVNKRVIVIKNPESEIFEEAYFIIRSNNIKGAFKQSKENEMVMEANRIISDYHSQQRSIIEKNGIASSIGGDMTELDNFLNRKNDTATKINNIGNNNGKTKKLDKSEKTDKINKFKKENSNGNDIEKGMDFKFDNSQKTEINNPTVNLSDEELFENMHSSAEKHGNICRNAEFAQFGNYEKNANSFKSAFSFISSKKSRRGLSEHIRLPPKSFFAGIGFMSAVIILIRLIEFIVTR